MLHDVDEAISGILTAAIIAGGEQDAVVGFEAPADGREGRADGVATLAAFLYDIRENLSGRGAGWAETRGADHRVAARQAALRRYELSYLITACAATARDEHRLLGMVLAHVASLDTVPARYLGESLARAGLPVGLRVADPAPAAAPRELWQALGIGPRACLDLVVTAALFPDAGLEIAPPAEHLVLGVNPAPGSAPAPAAPARDRQWTTTRVRERRDQKG